jgi:outer membrane receptor protein involved in Fe transport
VIDRFPTDLTPNDPRSPRTYVGDIGIDQPLDDYSGRLDWNPRSADTIFVRYQYTRQIFDNEDIIIGEATRQNNKQQNVGLTWTHLFTSNTVGEFRYGLGLRTTLVGIKAGDDTPIIRFSNSPVSGSIIGNAGAFPINRFQTDNQFVYNISTLFGGNHSFKAGTDIRRQKLDDLAQSFARPFYTFSNGLCAGVNYATAYDAFLAGCVTTFERTYGNFFLENRINESNFYAEDNWKVRPNLTLNIGARYEYVDVPEEAEGRINYFYKDDKDNIEPRVGFAYSPNFNEGFMAKLTGGPGNSSLRAGYGIYHGRLFQSVFSLPGASVRANVPNALRRTASGRTVSEFPNALNVADPFFGFVYDPATASNIRRPETRIDPNMEVPYTQQWTLSVERQLPFKSALRVTYTGNRGIGLPRIALGNLPVSPLAGGIVVPNHPNNAPAAGAPDLRGVLINAVAADVQCAGTGFIPGVAVNAACPNRVPIANNEVSLRVPRSNERRPDPGFLGVSFISNGVFTYYHGLQTEFNKRLTNGLQFQAAYTFSKAIDTTSDAAAISGGGDTNQTGNNPRISRGLARTHTPHRFTFNGSYLLPFFSNRQGFIKQALSGYQISVVTRLASGTPFTVTDSGGIDLNFDGFIESRPC